MENKSQASVNKRRWSLGAIADRVLWVIDTLVYAGVILVVLLQIFARMFLPQVPSWTEELSRYLQVYLVAFGAGLAIKYDAFVSVETIFNIIGKKASLILKMCNNVVVFVMFLFFAAASVDLYRLGIPRTAVTMPGITMNLIYFSMLLMSISVLYYLLRKEISLFRELKEDR